MSDLTVDRKLIEIFEEAFDLFYSFETCKLPINGPEFQALNKKCICLFEDCTRLVSICGLFSANESFTEIPTNDLKYLLLPFFLGTLSQKICGGLRTDIVDVAESYFQDFLKRCSDYGIYENCSISTCERQVEEVSDDKLNFLTQQVLQRNQKILKYRQKKELEEQIIHLKMVMKQEYVDDETKRNFYIKLLKMSIIEANEEISSIVQEKEILQFRQSRSEAEESRDHISAKAMRLLKPIIITRDLAQKAVYGLGYPSLPTMTVSEFYDQRVREGIFPDPNKSRMESNIRFQQENQRQQQEEQEDVEREEKLENDDEYELARLRARDEYKDEHRRGEGNRYNRS